jgi:RNA polymerase sigma-70 factor (ECF subfamily)
VQETFLALWNRAELFDPGSGSLATWLRAIARNRAVDRIRAAGRRPTLVAPSSAAWTDEPDADALERMAAGGSVVAGSAPEPGPESAAESASVRDAIREALAGLREEERTAIVLAYDLDLSQSEIAERLGWPIGTVKTRTRRALAHLREALGPELAPELGLVGAASARRNADGSR